MTGVGKGIFNIFVGGVLFIAGDDIMDKIMGWAMVGAGCIFLFLSIVKKMTDEDLQSAVSAMAAKDSAQAKKTAKKGYEDNKETIHSTAKDVAMNNKELVG